MEDKGRPQINSFPNFANLHFPGIDLSQGAGEATEVLCLMNMVVEDELKNDDEYEDILEDIRWDRREFVLLKWSLFLSLIN